MFNDSKCKQLLIEIASALVILIISLICPSRPIPPPAITGIDTVDLIDLINSISGPHFKPSLSTDNNNISPLPSSSAFFAHSIASRL